MTIDQLETRFRGSTSLLRGILQGTLETNLKSEPALLAEYLQAIGIEEGSLPDETPLWHSEPGTTRRYYLDAIFEPRKGPCFTADAATDSDLASLAASLFGMWVYFYDYSQATYYYPFPKHNLLFGSQAEGTGEQASRDVGARISPLNDEYKKVLETLLKDYRLTIGEGSHGLAAWFGRGVLLHNTLIDVRGAVALEDTFNRNFSYMAFPIFASSSKGLAGQNQDRFGTAPMAYVSLVFPSPRLADSGADLAFYNHLAEFMGHTATTILEPLISHFQDFLLIEKNYQMVEQMGRQRGGPFDAVRAFSDAVFKPTKSVKAGRGLRDPLGFAAIHIVPPASVELIRRDQAMVISTVGREFRSAMLRSQLERHLEPIKDRDCSPRAFHDELEKRMGFKVNTIKFGKERPAMLCMLARKDFNLSGYIGQLEQLAAMLEDPGELSGLVDSLWVKWAGPNASLKPREASADNKPGSSEAWIAFNNGVMRSKLYESLLAMIGRAIAGRYADSIDGGGDTPFVANLRTLKEFIETAAGDLEGTAFDRFLKPITDHWAEPKGLQDSFKDTRAAGKSSRDCQAIAAVYLLRRDEMHLEHNKVENDEEEDRAWVLRGLTRAPTTRVLSLVASLGHAIPVTEKVGSQKHGWRAVRFVPEWEKAGDRTGGWKATPIQSQSGVKDGWPFNYSLMTSLVFRNVGDKKPALDWTHLYWIGIQNKDDCYLVLGPELELSKKKKADLDKCSTLPFDDAAARLAEIFAPAPVLVMEWRRTPVGGAEASDEDGRGLWRVVSWKGYEDALDYVLDPEAREHGLEGDGCKDAFSNLSLALLHIEKSKSRKDFPVVISPAQSWAEQGSGGGEDSAVTVQSSLSIAKEWVLASDDADLELDANRAPQDCADVLRAMLKASAKTGDLVGPAWDQRMHLIRPLIAGEPDAATKDDVGLIVFSTTLLAHIEPLRHYDCPVALGNLHHQALDAATDHLEFVLTKAAAQQKFEEDMRMRASLVIHDSKNDWIGIPQQVFRDERIRGIVRGITHRHMAELAWYRNLPESSAWEIETVAEFELWLETTVNAACTKKLQDELGAKFAACVATCKTVASFEYKGIDRFLPLLIPRWCMERVILELVFNALKYSPAWEEGQGRPIRVAASPLEGEADTLAVSFSNRNGGPDATPGIRGYGIGIAGVSMWLKANFEDQLRCPTDLGGGKPDSDEVTFTVPIRAGIYRARWNGCRGDESWSGKFTREKKTKKRRDRS